MPAPDPIDRLVPRDLAGATRPVHLAAPETLSTVLGRVDPVAAAFAGATGFEAKAGAFALLPGADGRPVAALFGLGSYGDGARTPLLLGKLASLLPDGDWTLEGPVEDPDLAALAFLMEAYRYRRYKGAPSKPGARLVAPEGVDVAAVAARARAVHLGRDLVNDPPNVLGPAELAAAVRAEAERVGATATEIVGEALLAENFPLVHAVGAASERPPRIVWFSAGDPAHPKVTLVGKGVVYDTGGLDIKPSSSMALMKKDMGGAAATLALARMILDARLPVRLTVIVPAVENAVSGRAFRTGDVHPSRKGLAVEIGNTDAEGRLILADALALADAEAPDLMIDMATLTGAARVALGPDVPPFYTADDALAAELQAISFAIGDPLWRLPLHKGYAGWMDSKIADLSSTSSAPFAGSITAALFLERFVERAATWVHVDVYAWNPSARPGRPEGGEVQAARALFELIRRRYRA